MAERNDLRREHERETNGGLGYRVIGALFYAGYGLSYVSSLIITVPKEELEEYRKEDW